MSLDQGSDGESVSDVLLNPPAVVCMTPWSTKRTAALVGIAVLMGVGAFVLLPGPSTATTAVGSFLSLTGAGELADTRELAAGTTTDLLIITSVTCDKSAGGLSGGTVAGFQALSGIVAAGASLTAAGVITLGTGGVAAPVTVGAISAAASTAAGAAAGAKEAMSFLDAGFAGADDFIMKVDGEQVMPLGRKFVSMESGQTRRTNIRVSFQGHARISLVEWDKGDNDDLGSLDVHGGMDANVPKAVITAPYEEDGSSYHVSYQIQKGKGKAEDVVGYMLCGSNQCDACMNENCRHQPYGNLDRDKDHGDLKDCPVGMRTTSFTKYPQWWPASDVYLRVCKRNVVKSKATCNVFVFEHGWFNGKRTIFDAGR